MCTEEGERWEGNRAHSRDVTSGAGWGPPASKKSAELARQSKRKRKPHLGRLVFFQNSWGVRGKIQGGSNIYSPNLGELGWVFQLFSCGMWGKG